MSKKRRDKKGRVLRNGECQREDGRYQYDYIDTIGIHRCVYSWKLENTDALPYGKRNCKSLRQKEKEIENDISDGMVTYGDSTTVLELAQKYVMRKTGVRASTRTGYKTVLNLLKRETFGHVKIDRIKISDAKIWLIKLQQKDGKSYSTIHTIRGVLRPAFQMAVDDDVLRKNPFDFPLVNVIVNDSVRRDAITHEQKRLFLNFVKNDEHFSRYYEAIYILFYTGMRISEFTGLTVKDIDLKNKRVTINKQLLRGSDMTYIIEKPKTEAGTRVIPITDDVCKCFDKILRNRNYRNEPIINGHAGFLYLDKNHMPMVAMHWEHYFQHMVKKYNDIYKKEIPKITPHVCRHTYCSHMASTGINPKYLQYLMGHSDISVTLNTYTHVEFDNIEDEIRKLNDVVI